MRSIQEFSFLSPQKKHPHSSSFDHSTAIQKCSGWQGMKITMERSHSRSIPVIFSSFREGYSFKSGVGMTEWGQMRWLFRTKAKPLLLKRLSFHHHSFIPSEFHFKISSSHSFYGHLVIPNSFNPAVNFRIMPCWRYIDFLSKTAKRVLSLIRDSTRLIHSELIPSHF